MISKERLDVGAKALRHSQVKRAARTGTYLPSWDDLTAMTKVDLVEDTEAILIAVEKIPVL